MNNYIRLIKETKGKNHLLVFSILFGLISSVFMLIAPLVLKQAINEITIKSINKELILIAILYVLGGVFLWISNLLASRYAVYLIKNIRMSLITKLYKLPLSYLDQRTKGSITNNFVIDSEVVYDAINHMISQFFISFFMMVGSFTIMIYLNVILALTVLIISLSILFITKKINKLSEKHFEKLQKENEELNALASEYIVEQQLIYKYNYQEKAEEIFNNQIGKQSTSSKKANFISALANPATRLVNNIVYILIAFLLGYILTDSFDIGLLTSFIAYSQTFSKPINDLTNLTTFFIAGTTSLTRIFEILDENEEIDKIEFNDNDILKNGRISINHLFFGYKKGSPLIEDLNLEINSGDKVTIVGPTGSGKSTLINLLMRFYEPNQGNIMIDYKNINHISRKALHMSIGLVLQDPWLFEGTIKENIAYGKFDATDDEILEASRLSGADSFIETLKDGYNTKVLEDGRNLSIGQRQLLTIARTLILRPTILILDEATSSVDRLMEKELQKKLNKIIKNKTSFFIAHRLSSITDSKFILVMDKGRVIEVGNHEVLMNKKGFYYQLYNSQFIK